MANNKFLEETGLSRLWSHVKKLVDTRATKIETRVTSLENQVNADKLTAYPVGAIYMSVSSTSPASLFGGTWTQWGSGRVPIGINSSDSDFKTVEKTGGEKEHTLTVGEMPSHKHDFGQQFTGMPVSSGNYGYYMIAGTQTDVIKNTGGNQPHNNLQPYITCYMWKRVS